jgi:hypothetical protein
MCYVPATSAAFSNGIFVAAANSTIQANKAASYQSFLDVHGSNFVKLFAAADEYKVIGQKSLF